MSAEYRKLQYAIDISIVHAAFFLPHFDLMVNHGQVNGSLYNNRKLGSLSLWPSVICHLSIESVKALHVTFFYCQTNCARRVNNTSICAEYFSNIYLK